MMDALTAQGRLDVALLRLCEHLIRTHVEPRCFNLPLWDRGLGDVARAAVAEYKVPTEPVGPVEIARFLGVLPPAPRVRRRIKGAPDAG